MFAVAVNSLKYSSRQRVIFETAAVKAARPDTDYDFDALLSRIKTLEDKISGALGAGACVPCAGNPAAVGKTDTVETDVNGAAKRADAAEKTFSEQSCERVKSDAQQPNGSFLNNSPQSEPQTQTLRDLSEFSDQEIKGRLLTGLRKAGSEMLSLVVQNVGVKVAGGVLYLVPSNEEDKSILEKPTSLQTVKTALSGIKDFTVSVKESRNVRAAEEIDEATDKIKKIFGEDIVIIKR